MIVYEIIKEFGLELIKAKNGEDVFWVPIDSSNSDYQAYLNKDNPDWNKPTL
jgi:hypothetical protein